MVTFVPVGEESAPSTLPWEGIEGPITQEVIRNTPALRQIVEDTMRVRFRMKYKQFDPLFEEWQKYNRSLVGGQTITVASEVAFHQRAPEDDKNIIGAGYTLFDSMPSIFTKDVPWAEKLDAVGNYARAAIIDPINLIGLGIGKAAFTIGGKAGITAIRAGAKEAYKAAIRSGATKEVARQAFKKQARRGTAQKFLKNSAPLAFVDFASAIGSDLGYQYSLIQGGAQKNYSAAQVGLTALGTLVLPSLVLSVKGVAKFGKTKISKSVGMDNYIRISEMFDKQINATPKEIMNVILKETNLDLINAKLGILLNDIFSNESKYVKWLDDLDEGGKIIERKGLTLEVGEQENLFFMSLLLGRPDGKTQGIFQILEEAGFVYFKRGEDDKISHFIGDFISAMPDEKVNIIHQALQGKSSYLKELPGGSFKDLTAAELGKYIKVRTSNIAKQLAAFSKGKNMLGERIRVVLPKEMKDATKGMDANWLNTAKWLQTTYKKLLTAHTGTTGLNVQGWGFLAGLGTVADVLEGGLLLITGKGFGGITGAMRRGFNMFNYIDTLEAALDYLTIKSDVSDELLQFIAGGVDHRLVAADFGLSPTNKIANFIDKTSNMAQTVSMVRLQDELTKMLSFMSALDQEIRLKYGVSYNKFLEGDGTQAGRQKVWVDMLKPEFKMVEATAMKRAQREAASFPFSRNNPGGRLLRHVAKGIEDLSKIPGPGILVPFGQFFNQTIAFMGDYSGVNFIRHSWGRAIGQNIDYTEERGLQLLSKGLIGFGLVAYHFYPEAKKKLEEGLRWNQSYRGDGSVTDSTYLFPTPFGELAGMWLAFNEKYGEIPQDFQEEMAAIVYGQAFRQLGDAQENINTFIGTLTSGLLLKDDNAMEILGGMVSRIVSGATRFLDPINQAAMMLSDDYSNPDRRQGLKAFNESVRYLDDIFFLPREEERNDPLTTERKRQDMGRVIGGVRSSRNLTDIDRMLASAGMAPWKQTRWDGNFAQLKNRLDGLIAPIIDGYTIDTLRKYPDFFDLPLAAQEKILKDDIFAPAKKEAKRILTMGLNKGDVVLQRLEVINGHNKRDIRRAIKFFDYGESVEDMAMSLGGLDKLDVIIDYLENQEAYLNMR